MDKKQTTKKHHSKEPKNEKLTKVKKQYQNMNFITSKEIWSSLCNYLLMSLKLKKMFIQLHHSVEKNAVW